MGNSQSINKINFESVQNIINNNITCGQFMIINTLENNNQNCLIKNTLSPEEEIGALNNYLKNNKSINILIYGENCCDTKVIDKFNDGYYIWERLSITRTAPANATGTWFIELAYGDTSTYKSKGQFFFTGFHLEQSEVQSSHSPIYFKRFSLNILLSDNSSTFNEFPQLGGRDYTFFPYPATTPIVGGINKNSLEFKLLFDAIRDLKKVSYINEIFVASYDESIAKLTETRWIDRNQPLFNEKNVNVEKLLSLSLKDIESKGIFPEVILYVNHQYPFRPKNLFSDLLTDLQYLGLTSVFPCFTDYGHYWLKDDNGNFIQIDSSMDSRENENREPIMRALYGLGCATSSVEIRKQNITGNNVGIIPIDDYQYTLYSRDIGSKKIIKKLLNYSDEQKK